MAISIQTNVSAMNAQENLRTTNEFQQRTISRLTSGYRINQSGDDAAGLAVANKFRSDIAELTQGVRNANDGLSTMQIIDGGLSNISKMLDRLKTLATQSASSTFEGNRALLNTEYQDLATEITRQAESIGLGSGATGGRYNRSLEVYVGGGQQGTPKVSVDLAGSTSRVDSTGLLLSGTSIDEGGATLLTSNVVGDIRTVALLEGNAAGENQAFTFNINKRDGTAAFTTTVTVKSTSAAGIKGADAVSQLNNSLSQHGIAASLSTSGALQFSGSSAFTVAANAGSGGQRIVTNASYASNDSLFKLQGKATFGALTASTGELLTVKVGSSTAAVELLSTDGANAATLGKINAAFNGLGVYAVLDQNGDNIEFQSAKLFDVTSLGTNKGAAPTATEGLFNADTTTAGAQAVTSTATSAAEAAITAISAAVGSLGVVQGKIGTGQNKLQYAISLAQSQITNFSAAESRIRDADIAQEAANLTKAQVLSQASMAALAQANSAPQSVLSLLRG